MNDIGAASAVSEGYDIPLTRLVESTKQVSVIKLAKAIQMTDEAVLSGYGDPLGEAAAQLATAVDDGIDTELLAALAGNTAAAQNYSTADSGTALLPDDIRKALAKFGEDMDGTKILYVTPDFYTKLLGTDWIPASEIAANVRVKGVAGMAYGCQVVVTNRLVSSGNLYIVKPGALAVFFKRGVMIETDRDILNQSTVLTGSVLCAPYLLNPSGMIKLSVGA